MVGQKTFEAFQGSQLAWHQQPPFLEGRQKLAGTPLAAKSTANAMTWAEKTNERTNLLRCSKQILSVFSIKRPGNVESCKFCGGRHADNLSNDISQKDSQQQKKTRFSMSKTSSIGESLRTKIVLAAADQGAPKMQKPIKAL